MYLADLDNATEIVIDPQSRVVPEKEPARGGEGPRVGPRGASGRAVGAVRFAHAIGSVVTRSRAVGFAQSSLMTAFGGVMLGVTAIAVLWPRAVAFPLAFLMAWLGAALVVQGVRLRRKRARSSLRAQPDAARSDDT
jgi:cardiolipin synthase